MKLFQRTLVLRSVAIVVPTDDDEEDEEDDDEDDETEKITHCRHGVPIAEYCEKCARGEW